MTRDDRVNAGLAILRVVVGIIFIAHGWQKLFVYGIEGTREGFEGAGIPFAELVAPGIALLELLGGIALVLGVLTRFIAPLLALDMLGAIFIVHLAAGFFLPQGYEFTLVLFAACALLALLGAGKWSVDHALRGREA